MSKVKDIVSSERPRERLLKNGSSNLNNVDLLAILLKTGTFDKNVRELALEVINQYGGFSNLDKISVESLKKIKGIGEVKAIELVAALEFGRRIFLNKYEYTKMKLVNAKDIWEYTKYLFYGVKQEYFYALYFNNKQELISYKKLFMGTINKSVVHPREIFREAYLLSASSIICIHNHPSGDVKPSVQDIEFTESLIKIGKLQGIPILDHIIVSDLSYYSIYENNKIFNL